MTEPGWPRAEYAGDFLSVVYYNASLFPIVPEAPASVTVGRIYISNMVVGDLYEVVYGPVEFYGPLIAEARLGFFVRPTLPSNPTLMGRNHPVTIRNSASSNTSMGMSSCSTRFIAPRTDAYFEAKLTCFKGVGQTGDVTANVSQAMMGVRPVATASNFTVRNSLP